MTKPIVLLDLDDTILDFHKAEAIAIAKTFKDLGIEPSPELIARYSVINGTQWKRLEKGEISREQVQVGRFEILFGELGLDYSSWQAQSMYENYLSQGHYFIDGAEQLLEQLKDEYRLFICSNGNAVVQEGRLNSAGIKPYFEDIFISEDIGFDKPNIQYFDHCFEKIKNFDRARAIIIGDSLSSDILGGINAGIKSCWFNPKGKPRPEEIIPSYEISKLAQVEPLLKQTFVECL